MKLKPKHFRAWAGYCMGRDVHYLSDIKDTPSRLRALVACALNVGSQIVIRRGDKPSDRSCPLCMYTRINNRYTCTVCPVKVHFGVNCGDFMPTVKKAIKLYEIEYRKVF